MAANNRHIKYKCSTCGMEQPRDRLVAKQVRFYELGSSGKLQKTRTVAWIGRDCGCLDRDPAWNLPAFANAPGMADTALAAERTA